MEELLKNCLALAEKAGDAIMDIYESGNLNVETKKDNSPLTRADKLANEIIEAGLKNFSDFPIISEEGNHVAKGSDFWLVDPIDGTKEFISHNGEFAICIGLIKNQEPALGVVYAPAQQTIYYGAASLGAFKKVGLSKPEKLSAEFNFQLPVIAASRSHYDKETANFIKNFGDHEILNSGSIALKICLTAEGKAAIFPRLAPTHIWDTAAADAILRQAGGRTADLNGHPLKYEPNKILNPHFLATATNFMQRGHN